MLCHECMLNIYFYPLIDNLPAGHRWFCSRSESGLKGVNSIYSKTGHIYGAFLFFCVFLYILCTYLPGRCDKIFSRPQVLPPVPFP